MATGGDINVQFVRISDIAKEPQKMLMPIRGFEKMPLVPLEEAIQPLISILPEVQDYAFVAKERCEAVPADGLTRDQSASIILYTMEWEPHEECLYFALNATLRTEDRRKLRPWFSYLKLVITALKKLPPTRHIIYRGVKLDLSKQYPTGKTFIWWGFSSCTSKVGVLENEQFLGKTGQRTMFNIICSSGKDISRHSYYETEEEVLLLPARQFEVESSLQPAPGLTIIQLKETKASIELLDGVQFEPSTIQQPAAPTPKPVPVLPPAQPKVVPAASSKTQEFAEPGTFKELGGKCSCILQNFIRKEFYTIENRRLTICKIIICYQLSFIL